MLNRALLPALAAVAFSGALAGCVSLGPKTPPQLLTLTPARTAPAGAVATGQATTALAVVEPGTDQRLAVTRVPVQVTDASVAYLQDAVWVEKPSRLFQRLLGETIRARGGRLVVNQGDLGYAAATKLSGQLLDMGYDVASGSVVVRFDAMLQTPDGQVKTKRFENRVSGVPADAVSVGPALNQAANAVAAEVAEWVG